MVTPTDESFIMAINIVNKAPSAQAVVFETQALFVEKGNMVFNGSDANMKDFANKYLGYDRNKGLDFLAKFNDTYILAEAKFLTDFGGHQNAQFADAISTMKSKFRSTGKNVKTIAILDGVLYIESQNKMYKSITEQFDDNDVIVSAVLLRDYLYSI